MFKGAYSLILSCFIFASFISCQEDGVQKVSYSPIQAPRYDNISMEITTDTIHLPLNDTTYNTISSMNLFIDHQKEYLSIFDDRSGSVNIYQLDSQKLIKKVLPKNYLRENKLYKTSVYCKNFDSIFISNNMHKLFLLDTSGIVHRAFTFPDRSRSVATIFENYRPLIRKKELIYTGIRPTGLLSSKKELMKWKVLYCFNFDKVKTSTHYYLPERYRSSFYSYNYLDYSYCINDKSNIIFSFPADSNLYETDLNNMNLAHFGKSRFQQGDIKPVKDSEEKDDLGYKQFMLSDGYGPVYYDSYNKRYCRVFRKKLSEADFNSKKHAKKSIIIFNDALEIVGEWEIPEGISTSTLFFAQDGSMYCRVKNNDEYALHFVRLRYKEKHINSDLIAKNDSIAINRP